MTHRDLVLAVIRHEQTPVVPYTLGFEGGTDLELDAFYGSADWRDRLQQSIVGIAGIDTTVEREIGDHRGQDVFGSIWRSDQLPWHLDKPALDAPRMDALDWPPEEAFPMWVAPDVAQRTGPQAEQFTVCHVGWGIFEQTWRVRGFENMLMDTVEEPEFFEALLDRMTDYFLMHVDRLKDVPADGIFFGDDWGDQRGVILGPERWRRFVKPCWAKVYDAVHRQGKFVLSHCCGSVVDLIPDLIEMGLDVLESVQPEARGMNPVDLKRQFGNQLTFWGCLGSQSVVPFGTPEGIRNHIRALCREMGQDGGFILAPAKSIQPGTAPANAAAVVEAFVEQNP